QATETENIKGAVDDRVPLIALLLVQLLIGYEWFMSGLVKVVRGDFPSGLAAELTEKMQGAVAWYANFLNAVVIPNGSVFGYVIMISELLAGVALIGGALLWLFRWGRLPLNVRKLVLLVIIIAGLGSIFLLINLHLANGSAHPWVLPKSGFDEGVDLDSLLPAVQAVIVGVSVIYLARLRRVQALAAPASSAIVSGIRN
ncbi:MAG: hypothetical protein ABI970_17935, partial [Chloroflexota bacterium]